MVVALCFFLLGSILRSIFAPVRVFDVSVYSCDNGATGRRPLRLASYPLSAFLSNSYFALKRRYALGQCIRIAGFVRQATALFCWGQKGRATRDRTVIKASSAACTAADTASVVSYLGGFPHFFVGIHQPMRSSELL